MQVSTEELSLMGSIR